MDPYTIEKESELINISIETKDEIEIMAKLSTFGDLLKIKQIRIQLYTHKHLFPLSFCIKGVDNDNCLLQGLFALYQPP